MIENVNNIKILLRVVAVFGVVVNFIILVLSALLFTPQNSFTEIAVKTLPVTIVICLIAFIISFFRINTVFMMLLIVLILIVSTLSITMPLTTSLISEKKESQKIIKDMNRYLQNNTKLSYEQVLSIVKVENASILNDDDFVDLFKKLVSKKLIDPNTIIKGYNGEYILLFEVRNKDIQYLNILLQNGANPNLLNQQDSLIRDLFINLSVEGNYEKIRLLINCGLDIENKNVVKVIQGYQGNSEKYNSMISWIEDIRSGKVKRSCGL